MDSKKQIRTRFAPSPTGDPHIGNIWQALLAWLYARHHGGIFVLRIEDTDRTRFVEGSEARIIEALQWYGIRYDEGPDIGGPYGPYRQSERLEIYQQYAEKLIGGGHAYYCFCSSERLAKLREEQTAAHSPTGYDGRCRSLPVAEVERLLQAKEKRVIRLKFPREGETTFTDLIRGKITFQNALLDDQILLKSDGWPTYHLAAVVDDHMMEITTVIRGEEWLPSTPKHLKLYEMLEWEPPQFAHLPLILGKDRSKLSKRHGSTDALSFREQGYLADAMVNFLALLGWSPKSDQEIFSREELIEAFDSTGINHSGAIFDQTKLDWINGQYIRRTNTEDLAKLAVPFLERANLLKKDAEGYELADGRKIDAADLHAVLEVARERALKLTDIEEEAKIFFAPLSYEAELLIWKGSDKRTAGERLLRIRSWFAEHELTDPQSLEVGIKKIITDEALGNGETLWPLRVALSGQRQSPPPFLIAAILGQKETLRRLDHALKLLV